MLYNMSGSITDYHFENVKSYTNTLLKYSYDILFENDENGNWSMDWASGNAGFALTGSGSIDKTSFPTSSTTEGKEGKGLKLVTMSTGDFGKKVGMPIAAGNLFMDGSTNVLCMKNRSVRRYLSVIRTVLKVM